MLLFSAGALAANLTGTWKMDVETSMGGGEVTFELQQEGDQLTGTYNGQLGTADLTGTVEGDEFKFSYTLSAQGQSMDVTYNGKVVEEGKVEGEADYGEMLGKGTFTGTKE